MRSADEFVYSSRMTKAVSFDQKHFDVLTGLFTANANLPRSAAHQLVRVRSINLKVGIISISDIPNRKSLSLPLGLKENKTLCLSREDFSLNILDDWGGKIRSCRVRTPEVFRDLYYYTRQMKATVSRPAIYEKLLARYNHMSGFTTKGIGEWQKSISITRFFKTKTNITASNLISAFSGCIPPFTSRLNHDHLLNHRTKIGLRPEYSDIDDISADQYAELMKIVDHTNEVF